MANRLTPTEQECVKRKIRVLRAEGKPQDQAIAIAVSECAPKKARRSKSSDPTNPTRAIPFKPRYAHEIQPNGRHAIRDVPLFAVHTRRIGGKPFHFDKAWLERAAIRAKEQESDGYLARLHVRHHEPGAVKPEGIGFAIPRAVRAFRFDGEERPTLFGDLVDLDDETYEDIKNRRLPYLSVEIADPEEAEISSVALLPTESPWFKFPMITVSNAKPIGVRWVAYSETPGGGYSAVIDWRSCQMGEETKYQGDEMMPPEETTEEQPTEEAAADPMTEIMGKLDNIADMLTGLSQQIGAAVTTSEGDQAETVTEPAELKASGGAVRMLLAKQDAKIQAQAAKIESIETDREIDREIDEMRAKRVSFDEAKIRERMLFYAREHGVSPTIYAEEFMRTAVVAPPPTESIEDAPADDLPEQVTAYKAGSPETFAAAVEAFKAWNGKGDLAIYLAAATDGDYMTAARNRK